MENLTNQWLEKYEIVKSNFELAERTQTVIDEIEYSARRFELKKGVWRHRKNRGALHSKNVRLMFTGNMICSAAQLNEAKTDMIYNFKYSFSKLQQVLAQSDLAISNLETCVFTNAPYNDEVDDPVYANAPNQFLRALRYAGVDVLTTANNHDLDTGAVGLGESIDNISRFAFIQTGTFNEDKKHYEIIKINGIKIAIIAFTATHNDNESNISQEGIDFMLNDYSKDNAEIIINDARKSGANVVITCIHWGNVEGTDITDEQINIAMELAQLGSDAIIGTHPHSLQRFDIIETEEKKVPVFYSLGNTLSGFTDFEKSASAVACVDIIKEGRSLEIKCSFVPVFNSAKYKRKCFFIIPLKEDCENEDNAKRVEYIKSALGDKIGIAKSIGYVECFEDIEA